MKLNDKIHFCRKKANLSQEALAERIGVSRQAISKWETGEAAPEISKLPLLARVFGVTADWLLDDAAEPEAGTTQEAAEDFSSVDPTGAGGAAEPFERRAATAYPEWVEHLPGLLGRLVKRFGWLIGVYVALAGAGTAVVGVIARVVASSMGKAASQSIHSIGNSMFGGSTITLYDSAGNLIDPGAYGMGSSFTSAAAAVTQPFDVFCTVLIVIVMLGGAMLAWWLRKKGREAL